MMNESNRCHGIWYWAATALLLVAGAGALTTSGRKPVAIFYDTASRPDHNPTEPTVQELTDHFRQFRSEVGQLTPRQQDEVWQSLRDRTESLAERTLYTFFGLPSAQQQELLDRTVDRFEARRQMWLQWQERGGWAGSPRHEHGSGGWPVREVSGEPDWSRPFAELSIEERLALRRDMWEDTTLQAHAMRSEFLRLVNERRKERGLPEPVRRYG
jgi:hypothetical protein